MGYSREADSDWIVLKTTKGFTHNKGKRYTLATNAQKGQRVYVLQYPLGQPLRYSEGVVTNVKHNINKGLSIHSSGFAGTSGSPVVRVSDNEILGLFTRYDDNQGEYDFSQWANEICYITTVLYPSQLRKYYWSSFKKICEIQAHEEILKIRLLVMANILYLHKTLDLMFSKQSYMYVIYKIYILYTYIFFPSYFIDFL